jgi:mRNA interferase MazF
VAQVTRTIHNVPSEVRLTRRHGMPKDCVVNCDVLLTVPKARLITRIRKLSNAKMQQVNQALKFALEIR